MQVQEEKVLEVADPGDPSTYGLQGRGLRILQLVRWAGMAESAHFFQRVGDAIRYEAADDADDTEMYGTSKHMYACGIELDPTIPALHAGLARAYDSTYDVKGVKKAIPHMIRAVDLSRDQLTAEGLTDAVRSTQFGLRQEWLFRLGLYYKWTADVDKRNDVFEGLLEGWEGEEEFDLSSQRTHGAIIHMSALQEDTNFASAAIVMKRLATHPHTTGVKFHFLYLRFYREPNLLLQIAYESDCFELLDSFWANGLQSCARYGEDGDVSALRFHRAYATLKLCPERAEDAVVELDKIVSDVEVATPSNEYHWVKERAERELARIYLDRALKAREEDRWHQVGVNVDHLVRLCRVHPDEEHSETVDRECSLMMAAWNRMNGQHWRALQCARPRLERGINVLTDSDPTNDMEAWQCIGDACLAVGDIERAASSVGMQKQLGRYGANAIEGVTEKVEAEDTDNTEEAYSGEDGDRNDSQEQDSLGPSEPEAKQAHPSCPGAVETNGDQDGDSEVPAAAIPQAEDADPEEQDDSEELELYICDGPCFKSIPSKDTFSDFCQSCHNLITGDKMEGFAVCSQSHERHIMPALSKESAPGCIEADGKSVPVAEWLQDLKQDGVSVGSRVRTV